MEASLLPWDSKWQTICWVGHTRTVGKTPSQTQGRSDKDTRTAEWGQLWSSAEMGLRPHLSFTFSHHGVGYRGPPGHRLSMVTALVTHDPLSCRPLGRQCYLRP